MQRVSSVFQDTRYKPVSIYTCNACSKYSNRALSAINRSDGVDRYRLNVPLTKGFIGGTQLRTRDKAWISIFKGYTTRLLSCNYEIHVDKCSVFILTLTLL